MIHGTIGTIPNMDIVCKHSCSHRSSVFAYVQFRYNDQNHTRFFIIIKSYLTDIRRSTTSLPGGVQYDSIKVVFRVLDFVVNPSYVKKKTSSFSV